jgi:soluble lytic murein transglycosylase-like protein
MTAHTAQPAPVDPAIVGDIRRAARATNIDFAYLMAQANTESAFQPDAKAPTSSATGLYQFIDETWLGAVKAWGARYGLGQYAAEITLSESGRPQVADPATRRQILDLRKDPAASAALAAELARANKAEVETGLGRPASATDLYLAHFLGAQGATDFVRQIEHDGSAKAADLLPQAASANRWVFYDEAGQPKTVSQIYRNFADRIERQVAQYAGDTGVGSDAAAEALAFQPGEEVRTDNPGLLAQLNVLSMAAMKLLGRHQDDADQQKQAAAAQHRRPADTSA